MKKFLIAASWFALNCYAAEHSQAAVDLTFYGDGNQLSNDIGVLPYNQTGFFDYVASVPGRTVPASDSWIDPVFNSTGGLVGEAFIPNEGLINGTVGRFYFYPELFSYPTLDQVYVQNMGLYLDPAKPVSGAPATPEASTLVMLTIGLGLLALPKLAMARAK